MSPADATKAAVPVSDIKNKAVHVAETPAALEGNAPPVEDLGRRRTSISLRAFWLFTNISSLLLFFLIVLYLLHLQNQTTTLRSNLQIQGQVSHQIERQVLRYFENASKQLNILNDLMRKDLERLGGLQQDDFLSLAETIVKMDGHINAVYCADEHGNFYMAKRIRNGVIGRKIVTPRGSTTIERWNFLNGQEFPSYPARREVPSSQAYDPRQRSWYSVAKSNKEYWHGPYIFYTDKFMGMTGVIGLGSSQDYKVIGIDIDISDLSSFLQELAFSKVGYIVIKDASDNLVAVSDKERPDYSINQIKFYVQDNRQEFAIQKVAELDSSSVMSFFAKRILSLNTKQLQQSSVWEENTNLLEQLLTMFFPRRAKSSNVRNILIKGIDYGTIERNEQGEKRNYLFTHNAFHPFEGISWEVYTFTDVMDISNSLDYLSKIITWIFLGFILLFIFILQYVSKLVSQPLSELSRMMENFRQHLALEQNFVDHSRLKVKEIENIGNVYNNLQNGFRSFKKFVPDVIVRRSMNSSFLGKNQLNSQMHKRQVSILFSDIEGFTSIAERLQPEVLCRCLEVYFSLMSQEIGNNQGIVDKFIGDAIMALFGAFHDAEDEAQTARQAVQAALSMQKKSEAVQRAVQKIDPSVSLRTRIGISTGQAMVGIFGSRQRLNFTAMGDRVNLASRLEAVNKKYKTPVIVSERTRELAADTFIFRYLGRIQVRGKEQTEKIYQPIGPINQVSDYYKSYYKNFGQLQSILEKGDWNLSQNAVRKMHQHFPGIVDPLFEQMRQQYKSKEV